MKESQCCNVFGKGKISIGSGELGAMEAVARLCASFREKYPRVRFDMYTAAVDVVKEQMERGILDLGLLLDPIDMERFKEPLKKQLH